MLIKTYFCIKFDKRGCYICRVEQLAYDAISYLDIETDRIPIFISTLSVFLASLFQKCLAAATLSAYNSAIGYVHKLNGVSDLTTSFFILKLLQDAKRSRVQVDARLPITR
jgi:hypothetical protein